MSVGSDDCADCAREDGGNYTCEVRGKRSTILASVTHHLHVRGTRLHRPRCASQLHVVSHIWHWNCLLYLYLAQNGVCGHARLSPSQPIANPETALGAIVGPKLGQRLLYKLEPLEVENKNHQEMR